MDHKEALAKINREYYEAITTEFNRWALRYNEALKTWNSSEMSLAAFFCNAISGRVLQSHDSGMVDYFYQNAIKCD